MAKNFDNDGDPIVSMDSTSLNLSDPDPVILERVVGLSRRQRVLAFSFLALALVMLSSFLIPERFYHRNICYVILNLELLILLGKDIYLYWSKSCKIIKSILGFMTLIPVLNVLDLLFDIPHSSYLQVCLGIIVFGLGLTHLVGYKTKM